MKEKLFFQRQLRKKTNGNQKHIDTNQQNHVYFVKIACKFILVTQLIVIRVASQYYSCQNSSFFVCVLFPVSGVFTTHSISLIFI